MSEKEMRLDVTEGIMTVTINRPDARAAAFAEKRKPLWKAR